MKIAQKTVQRTNVGASVHAREAVPTNAAARAGRSRPHLNMQELLRDGRYVLFRRGCAFTEKVLFHLLDDRGLVLAAGGVKPVLVQQHLAEFRPSLPG